MTAPLQQMPGVCHHLAATVRAVLSESDEPLRAHVRADLKPRFSVDGSLGVSWCSEGHTAQINLTGGEVLGLDRDGCHAFQAGFRAGFSW